MRLKKVVWGLAIVGVLLGSGIGTAWAQGLPEVPPLRPLVVPIVPFVPDSLAPRVQSMSPPAAPADPPGPWKGDLIGMLSASQAAYDNWTEGGLSTLAFTIDVKGHLEGLTDNWEHRYDARVALGFIQQDTFAVRKASDLVRLTGVVKYQGTGFFETFNPTFATEVRTQLITGYNYKKDPLDQGRVPPVEVSDFLAPGTFTQTIGLTFDPDTWFTQRLSFGTKEVVVTEGDLRPLYGLKPNTLVHVEAGLEATTRIRRQVSERVYVESTLGLFAAFNQDLPDMTWESLLQLKFNEWLSVNVELATLYDRDIDRALQVKEVLSVGASIELL